MFSCHVVEESPRLLVKGGRHSSLAEVPEIPRRPANPDATEGIGVIPLKNTKTRIFRNLAGMLAVLGIAMFGFAQAPAAASVTGINLAESSEMGQYLVDD